MRNQDLSTFVVFKNNEKEIFSHCCCCCCSRIRCMMKVSEKEREIEGGRIGNPNQRFEHLFTSILSLPAEKKRNLPIQMFARIVDSS